MYVIYHFWCYKRHKVFSNYISYSGNSIEFKLKELSTNINHLYMKFTLTMNTNNNNTNTNSILTINTNNK